MSAHSLLRLVGVNLVMHVSTAWSFGLKSHTRDRASLLCYIDLLLSDLRSRATERGLT